MLRSLLYQLFQQVPDLTQHVYPDLWLLFGPDGQGQHKLRDEARVPLDIEDLMKALQKACRHLAQDQTRLCFFIDGLDEYEGQPKKIIGLINVLRTGDKTKICASSRPWNEFEDAYGRDKTRKLCMEDFNRYHEICSRQVGRPPTIRGARAWETAGEGLTLELVKASRCVFLWVRLVVESFIEGLIDGERISQLRTRLAALLPKGLNSYFRRILLDNIKEEYRQTAAHFFLVALNACDMLFPMSYWYIMEEGPDYALKMEIGPLSNQIVDKRRTDIKLLLNARCKGLLQIRDDRPRPEDDIAALNQRVEFLHRTVRDFLELPETQALLLSWSSAEFDPHQAVLMAALAQVKILPMPMD